MADLVSRLAVDDATLATLELMVDVLEGPDVDMLYPLTAQTPTPTPTPHRMVVDSSDGAHGISSNSPHTGAPGRWLSRPTTPAGISGYALPHPSTTGGRARPGSAAPARRRSLKVASASAVNTSPVYRPASARSRSDAALGGPFAPFAPFAPASSLKNHWPYFMDGPAVNGAAALAPRQPGSRGHGAAVTHDVLSPATGSTTTAASAAAGLAVEARAAVDKIFAEEDEHAMQG